jgi:hypothetical protein
VRDAGGRERIPLTADATLRYYLVWITSLPEDSDRVELSEIVLFTSARR